MKTLLISTGAHVPDSLRDIIERGSTTFETRGAYDLAASDILRAEPDRVVFWQSSGEDEVGKLAHAVAAHHPREDSTAIVFVTAGSMTAPPSLAPDQVFVWPRDEDRLKMAFMTGA